MSRIGKMPIAVPDGVAVKIEDNKVVVTGPKGSLERCFNPEMTIALDGGSLTVSRPGDDRQHRAMHGLTRTLLDNMVKGVSNGFEKKLEIVGVGYRAEMSGQKLVLRIGFSHPVEFEPPAGLSIVLDGQTKIKVQGIDKEKVGQLAAEIRGVHPPDSYKGKGIRYAGEVVRIKAGKTGKSGGGKK
ncbi:MAG: 50S ribosomal protein L6 [Dehalococcoidales bacterium]|jgi:large subunit ribosomal protein L6|nr:50S ribosomal protein L6 [Dehalococcoidales bacterium]